MLRSWVYRKHRDSSAEYWIIDVSQMLNTLSVQKWIGAVARCSPQFVFVCCLFITAFVLARSNVLFSTHWSPTLWPQALVLFTVVGLVATAIAFVSTLLRLKLEILFVYFAIVMIVMFCGPAATAVVMYFLISAACLARLMLLPFGVAEDIPFNLQIVVGWAAFAVLFTVLAPVRMHFAAVHTVILAIPIVIVAVIPALRDAIRLLVRDWFCLTAEGRASEPFYAIGIIVCTVVLSFHLAEVALPERYFDAMVTHLYVPSYMAGNHAWPYDVKHYSFAYMVMAVDFLYADMFLLQGEQAVRLLNFVALLFTCIAIFQIAVRCCSRTAAIWTVALFVSIPVALIESTSLFVEHTLALFVASAVLAIVLSKFRVSLLSHAVIMIVLAAATMSKLHGAVAAVIIGGASAALYLYQRRQRSDYIKFALITVAAAGLALWPYAEAWLNTGNPIFPFFNLIFKSSDYPLVNFLDRRWTGHLSPWMLFNMTFHSSKFLECTDGALGFSLFVFLAAGTVAAVYRRNMITLFCVGLAILLVGVVSLQEQYLRYLFIFTPPLMIGVAFAIDELGRERPWRAPVATVVAIVVVLNVLKFPAGGWVIGASNLRGIFDNGARRELELAQAPERIANQMINDIAGPAAKVLYATYPFAGLLAGTAIYDSTYNTADARALASITSENDVEAQIRRIGPKYVIFDPERAKSPPDAQRYPIIEAYLRRRATLVAHIGRLSIYRISLPAN